MLTEEIKKSSGLHKKHKMGGANKIEFVWYAGLIFLSLLIVVFIYDLLNTDIRVPFVYSSDALGMFLETKNAMRGGSPYNYNCYAAPFGSEIKYAISDYNSYLIVLAFLGRVFGDAWIAVNIFLILSYVLTTITGFYVARYFKISHSASALVALLYSFLPYHTFRNELHFTLSLYYYIPLLLLLIIDIMRNDDSHFHKREILIFNKKVGLRLYNKKYLIFLIAVCTLVGLGSFYYAGFVCLLLLFSGVFTLAVNRNLKKCITALGMMGLILAFAVISLIPSLLATMNNNVTSYGVVRINKEIEQGSLYITSMFLPIFNHIGSDFFDISIKINGSLNFNQENALVQLGLFLSIGLLISVIYIFRFRNKENLLTIIGLCNLYLLLLSMIGGLDSLVAMFLTSSIRAYNRIIILIAYLAALSFGLFLDYVLTTAKKMMPYKNFIFFVILGSIAFLDMVPTAYSVKSWVNIPDHKEIESTFWRDKEFTANIEEKMQEGDSILELPIVTEDDINVWIHGNRQGAYSHYIPVINSTKTNWSQGGLINSKAYFWKKAVRQLSDKDMLKVAVVSGFDGIYINQDGYKDGAFDKLVEVLSVEVGAPMTTTDKELYFFDLAKYKKNFFENSTEKEITDIEKMTLVYAEFRGGVIDDKNEQVTKIEKNAELIVGNTSNDSLETSIIIDIELITNNETTVFLTYHGVKQAFNIENKNSRIIYKLNLDEGANQVEIECSSPIKVLINKNSID